MSARPKMSDSKKHQELDQRVTGQDIFVEGDPALGGNDSTKKDAGVARFPTDDLKLEKLTYVHQMLTELRKLSVTLDEPMVAYLIEMALLETDTALNVGQFNMDLGKKDKSTSGL